MRRRRSRRRRSADPGLCAARARNSVDVRRCGRRVSPARAAFHRRLGRGGRRDGHRTNVTGFAVRDVVFRDAAFRRSRRLCRNLGRVGRRVMAAPAVDFEAKPERCLWRAHGVAGAGRHRRRHGRPTRADPCRRGRRRPSRGADRPGRARACHRHGIGRQLIWCAPGGRGSPTTGPRTSPAVGRPRHGPRPDPGGDHAERVGRRPEAGRRALVCLLDPTAQRRRRRPTARA